MRTTFVKPFPLPFVITVMSQAFSFIWQCLCMSGRTNPGNSQSLRIAMRGGEKLSQFR